MNLVFVRYFDEMYVAFPLVVDTSILHHAFISIFIALWAVICHNTYGYSLLFYKVYLKRENAGSWNSRLEKEQILKDYSVQLQKS